MDKKIIIAVFLAGLVLRLLLPMDRVFNFDQDQLALNAVKIARGNLTAIGPQVSGMSFFLGPLIYYVAAVFYQLTNFHPLANALTSACIYCFSFGLIWYFFKSLFVPKLTCLYLSIYALSPLFVQLDRITWNPNFSFLSASLVLASLLKPSKLSLWLGMFLAYQAHFSGFILLPILIIYLFWQRPNYQLILVGLSGFFTSLIPLLIFDSRHQWLNLSSLVNFTAAGLHLSGSDLLHQFQTVSLICLENLTKIFSGYFFPQLVLVLAGLMILILWFRLPRSLFSVTQKRLLWFWLLAFPLAAIIYRGDMPEYYFLMQFPALVFMVVDLLVKIKKPGIIFLFLIIISLGVVFDKSNGYSLKDKFQAAQYIERQAAGRPVQIVFDMDYRERFGWDYLFQYFRLDLASCCDQVHLIYPVLPSTRLSGRFGDLGVFSENFIEYNKISL